MIGLPMRCIIRRAGSGASGAAPLKKKRTDEKSCLGTSGLIARPRTIGGTMKQTVARCRSTSVQYSTMSKRGMTTCVAPRLIAPVIKRLSVDMEVGEHVQEDVVTTNRHRREGLLL